MGKSRELYEVQIEYTDVAARREWDRLNDGAKHYDELPPLPDPKKARVYVGVYPGWAGDPLTLAGNLAVERVIGDRECWDEYQPIVKYVFSLGTVFLEENEEAEE